MPDAHKGAAALFRIGPAADQLTTISGAGNGLSSVEIQPTAGTRLIPGGGPAYRQLDGTTDWSLPFEVDANPLTWPLLWNKVGADLYFELGPLGDGAGMPKVTAHGIISVPLPIDTGAVLTFSTTVEADGPLAVAAY